MAFKFESLIVWQKGLDLTERIDSLTKTFPKEELYILTAQIKRAADSIVLNIAEGSTGQTNKEFSRFLGIALRLELKLSHVCLSAENEKSFRRRTFTPDMKT